MNAPVVSVIIVCLNNIDFTRRAVDALRRHTPASPYELILVDNASTDDTASYAEGLARDWTNVKFVRNADNLGFGGGNNRGAAAAEGAFLFFLNNDAEVQADWLDSLLDLASRRDDAGAIGCKLVYPDGRLQEAGGLIFRDGSGWNYGRFDDPDAPEYCYVREVDYCSAAALLVRSDLFRAVGGFDDRYYPAYYEDVDLCFAVRHAGFRVLYQPLARVIHHEGATGGTDTSAGAKRYQVLNRTKFVAKWQIALMDQPAPPAGPRGARDASDRGTRDARRLLIVIDGAAAPASDWREGIREARRCREAGLHVTCVLGGRRPAGDPAALRQAGVQVVELGERTLDSAMASLLADGLHDDLRAWPASTAARLAGNAASGGVASVVPSSSSGGAPAGTALAVPRMLGPDADMSGGIPYVANLTFGQGFHPGDGEWMWVGPDAELFVWHEGLDRPRVLSFEATSARASCYGSLPFACRVVGGIEPVAARFLAGSQTQLVTVPLPQSARDLVLRLESEAFFIPGDAAEGPEGQRLSFQAARLRLHPVEMPTALPPTADRAVRKSAPARAAGSLPEASMNAVTEDAAALVAWRCNVCGLANRTAVSDLLNDSSGRETPSCVSCGSSIRTRSIVHLLSIGVHGESRALDDFPLRRDVRGIGLGDWDRYAVRLAERFDYTNTHLLREPLFDRFAADHARHGTLDFFIASHVFDGVPPPIERAFDAAYRLLKPGGLLVFSVRYSLQPNSHEHFPELYRWDVIDDHGGVTLRNVTADGREQVFRDVRLCGGAGSPVEMRVFCESDVLTHLSRAGFHSIQLCREPRLDFGVWWPDPWSVPLSARK